MREAQSLARLSSCLVRELRRAVGSPLSPAEPRSFLGAHHGPQQQLEESCSRSCEEGNGLSESCNLSTGLSNWWETTTVQTSKEKDRAATNAAASTSEPDVFGQSGERCNSKLLSSLHRVSLHTSAQRQSLELRPSVQHSSWPREGVRVAPAVQPKPAWQAPRKAKPEEPGQKRLNRDITARTVRLVISEDGKEHVILAREEALARAQERGVDLVEVDGAAEPPVCRLLDYAKHRFELRKKEKAKKVKLLERRRESTTKELRISSRTENKDLEMKAKMACGLLARGYRIKCFVKFKGRDRKYGMGLDLLDRMIPMVGEHAKVEIPPKLEQGLMVMFLRPPATSAKSKAVKANDVAKVAEVSSPVALDDRQSEVQSDASEHVLDEIEEDYDEDDYDDESDEDEPRRVGL